MGASFTADLDSGAFARKKHFHAKADEGENKDSTQTSLHGY
jgi:hypothetical protein